MGVLLHGFRPLRPDEVGEVHGPGAQAEFFAADEVAQDPLQRREAGTGRKVARMVDKAFGIRLAAQ